MFYSSSMSTSSISNTDSDMIPTTFSSAKGIAFKMLFFTALALDDPCILTTGPLTPKIGAPPYSV